MKLSELKLNENNPRTITKRALNELKQSIRKYSKFLELRPIIIDDDGTIIAGNMRYRALKELGYDEVPDSWVRYASQLTEKEKKAFMLIDNSPKVLSGTWDKDALKTWDPEVLNEFKLDSLINTVYTTKIEAPIYEIKGLKPSVSSLYDDTEVNELIELINQSNVPTEVKKFLILSAYRFTKFYYSKIAEYYAHADKETQELMERLALIIIDYNKAIEYGFVELSKRLKELLP